MEERSYGGAAESRRSYAEKLRLRLEAFFLGALCFIVGLGSSANLPLTWDEGDAFFRAINVGTWTKALIFGPQGTEPKAVFEGDPVESYANDARTYFGGFSNRRALFSREALNSGFPHIVAREGHPAGYSIALALSKWGTEPLRRYINEKQGYRCGGIALYGLALGGIYYFFASRFGRFFGLGVAFLTFCLPRVWGHVQIAGGDSLLISSWLLAWILFDGALRSKRGSALWGVALGISFSAKFSGFLLPAPFLAVLLVESFYGGESRRVKREKFARFTLGVLVGFLTFFALDPPLWRDPFGGMLTFWRLNTTREGFDIPVFFLGTMYSPSHPLPWWNGFFWVGVTTPLPILLAALWGLWNRYIIRRPIAYRSSEEHTTFSRMYLSALALGLTLPIARCFPGIPVHDGARLLIASCSFWGALAGLAFLPLVRPVLRREKRAPRMVSPRKRARRERIKLAVMRAVLIMIALVGAVDAARSYPTYLSFYNAAIGGVAGAYLKGLEPTYYWDSLDPDAVCLLQTELEMKRIREMREKKDEIPESDRKNKLLFSAFSGQTLAFYRHWRTFGRYELATISSSEAWKDLENYAFYVMQFRPSGMTELDLALLTYAEPVGERVVSDPIDLSFGRGVNEVSVLKIYDMDDVKVVLQALSPTEFPVKAPSSSKLPASEKEEKAGNDGDADNFLTEI